MPIFIGIQPDLISQDVIACLLEWLPLNFAISNDRDLWRGQFAVESRQKTRRPFSDVNLEDIRRELQSRLRTRSDREMRDRDQQGGQFEPGRILNRQTRERIDYFGEWGWRQRRLRCWRGLKRSGEFCRDSGLGCRRTRHLSAVWTTTAERERYYDEPKERRKLC